MINLKRLKLEKKLTFELRTKRGGEKKQKCLGKKRNNIGTFFKNGKIGGEKYGERYSDPDVEGDTDLLLGLKTGEFLERMGCENTLDNVKISLRGWTRGSIEKKKKKKDKYEDAPGRGLFKKKKKVLCVVYVCDDRNIHTRAHTHLHTSTYKYTYMYTGYVCKMVDLHIRSRNVNNWYTYVLR